MPCYGIAGWPFLKQPKREEGVRSISSGFILNRPIDDFEEKLQLEYPCAWVYKVIGIRQVSIENAVSEILGEKPWSMSFSNQSRTRKYLAFNVEVVVANEQERNTIFRALKAHAEIKMVL